MYKNIYPRFFLRMSSFEFDGGKYDPSAKKCQDLWQLQQRETQKTIGSCPGDYPAQALQHSNRGSVYRMDVQIHPFPWKTPSQRFGAFRDRGVPIAFGTARQCGRVNTESGI